MRKSTVDQVREEIATVKAEGGMGGARQGPVDDTTKGLRATVAGLERIAVVLAEEIDGLHTLVANYDRAAGKRILGG